MSKRLGANQCVTSRAGIPNCQNQVVTREQLLESVWRLPATTNTRTVDNFLVRLRKRFEPDASAPVHFLTVRGAGYRYRP